MMLTWEFPPRIIGGISSHVNDLSEALVRKGLSVHVITCDFPGTPYYEEISGVRIHRFNSYKIPSPNFLAWTFSMNQNMAEKAVEVIEDLDGNVDVIHAHDWLVANAAINLKQIYGKPVVATMHATEYGRRGGIHDDFQRIISDTERRLIAASSQVICCSNYMAKQISEAFGFPRERLSVIPNGVNISRFGNGTGVESIRRQFAKSGEKIVLFVGRLVQEKGVHVLVGAIPKVLQKMPDVNFVIVGEGGLKEYLLREAWDFGVGHNVFFTGFADPKRLASIYKASDVAVFPSLYEPFGITALEAMAAQTPVVVSSTGGLAEIVEHEKTGLTVYPDNSDSLAWAILKVLQNPSFARNLRKQALLRVQEKYDWDTIAAQTVAVYDAAESLVTTFDPSKLGLADKLTFQMDRYADELKVVLMLYVLGAVNAQVGKTSGELSRTLSMGLHRLRFLLQQLSEAGYVAYVSVSRSKLYYLTESGIIKACSIFS